MGAPGSGWVGSYGQLLHTLATFGADRDEGGRFLIYGTPPSLFMGVEEESNTVVVAADCECEIKGQRANVAGLLGATSYGVKVWVV